MDADCICLSCSHSARRNAACMSGVCIGRVSHAIAGPFLDKGHPWVRRFAFRSITLSERDSENSVLVEHCWKYLNSFASYYAYMWGSGCLALCLAETLAHTFSVAPIWKHASTILKPMYTLVISKHRNIWGTFRTGWVYWIVIYNSVHSLSSLQF